MKSSAYWQERFKLVEQAQNQLGVQCYAQIEQQYKRAQRQLEAQINTWYQRFADNNSVTLQEARKMLTNRELSELKWDINQYIQYGEENAINWTWMKQLENASARYHISRLEALKLQSQQSIEMLFGNQLDTIDAAMKDIYTSGYYHTAFEIQKGVGVAWDFATLDDKSISKVINKPWAADGKNFSARVWENRQKLVNELNTELTRNIILGQDPQKAIDAIAKKMNTSRSNAGRLVMTEEAFFSSAAQKDCFEELDVEQFEIVATIDSHTSEICQEMDGKVFPMSQWEVGVTAPPFHVRCRSTTVPAFGDEFDSIGERAARGEDGKTYYVPASMTYSEWKKAMVDGDKSGLRPVQPDGGTKPPKRKKKAPDKIMDNLPDIAQIHSDSDIQHFSEQLIDNLGIDRTNISIQVKGMVGSNGGCEVDTSNPAEILTKCKYDAYRLLSNDSRPMEYRIKTAFHESYHLNLNGRRWDAIDKSFKANKYWDVMEETFAESSAHYMLERYGVTKKLMPAYPDRIVRNLPRLKQLSEFSMCETIQDFGKVAFEARQSGGDGVWKPLYDRMKKVTLDKNYYTQYFDYIREDEDDLFDMICENITGMEDFKDNIIKELHNEMSLFENTGVQPDPDSVYYWFMSCAMQMKGVK